jgi:hypothetical protein
MKMKTLKLLFVMTCVGMLLLPGKSFADPANAHVVIDNPTGTMIHYQFKWGDNAGWKYMDLQPGYHMDHTYKYNPMGVPAPYISFVRAQGFEGGLYTSYKLRIGWDKNPSQYHFERNDRGELDLLKD